jgi:hypothetical protein
LELAGIGWGEPFTLITPQKPEDGYKIALPIFDVLPAGSATQALRLELTAYEDQTQVDSTSLVIQILHDPFELQNPLPNHELLERVAKASGGQMLREPSELKLATTQRDNRADGGDSGGRIHDRCEASAGEPLEDQGCFLCREDARDDQHEQEHAL